VKELNHSCRFEIQKFAWTDENCTEPEDPNGI